jgi:hypothetical protein
MASPFSWPVSVPSALRAPAPVNFGVRPKESNHLRKIMSYQRSLFVLAMSLLSCAAWADDTGPKIYQLDLFSLISFGLSIASLVVTIFLGWLSWRFYVQSNTSAEKSQEAVSKIESTVVGIQSDIKEIVRQAVGQWTGGQVAEEAIEAGSLNAKFEELASQINQLAGNAANKEEMEKKLAEILQIQREQVSNFTAAANEAKARALFPSINERGPVSEYTHTVIPQVGNTRRGQLVITVHRAVKVVTHTFTFEPALKWPPLVTAKLVNEDPFKSPFLRVTCGLGHEQQMNIHLMSQGGLLGAAMVQPGTYVVEYEAHEPPQRPN